MIRVTIPHHLRTLAGTGAEVRVMVYGPATIGAALDALEAAYPVLRGTIRDPVTKERRPFLRFFVCLEDWSHKPPDAPLPEAIVTGAEPFMIIGAIAGG
ncbi:MAG: MoaD/ThiS family protein [Chloroflexi bacterium]|nr:MoaD/ThiS family protein [Chloroflexota bacterium]